MATTNVLDKLHQICATFPEIKFSDKNRKQHETSRECFAYSCVKGSEVYVSFRLSVKDLFKAIVKFKLFSLSWTFRQGVWITVSVDDSADWTSLYYWIAKSYRNVVGKPSVQYNFPKFLNNSLPDRSI